MNVYPPRRYQKAMNLTAHVMSILDNYLPYNCDKRAIVKELEDLFYATGADIITEADRIQAGCMPRDHNGLTLEEIKIIDARYIKAMLEPLNLNEIGVKE